MGDDEGECPGPPTARRLCTLSSTIALIGTELSGERERASALFGCSGCLGVRRPTRFMVPEGWLTRGLTE